MNLQTKIPIPPARQPITYQSELLLVGSCFAEHITQKFTYYGFRVVGNPFGVLFHPLAIERLLCRVVERIPFTISDFFFHEEQWKCFELHSSLNRLTVEEAVEAANAQLKVFRRALTESSHCFLTLGTAWVYRHQSGALVANCHRVPNVFTKELLSSADIEQSLRRITAMAHTLNPKLHFVLTVSPVRHLKDGFMENNLSKGNLFAGLYPLLSEGCSYFPAYELLLDELRDYRFYAEDMLHPSPLAVDYIWQRLVDTYMDESTKHRMFLVEQLRKMQAHKPFNPESDAHKKFLQTMESRRAMLNEFGIIIK